MEVMRWLALPTLLAIRDVTDFHVSIGVSVSASVSEDIDAISGRKLDERQ